MSLAQFFTLPALNAQSLTYASNRNVYDSPDPASYIYYIRSGEVRTFQLSDQGEERLLEILGPDDWFNPAGFSKNQVCGHRAIAVTQTSILRISSEKVLAELGRNPLASAILLKQFAERLQSAREDAASLVFYDCNARLIRTLLQLSQTVAATPRPDGVELRITHMQLAQAVGAARETVSLALTDLRKQNLLRTGRNKLYYDPQVLRDLQQISKLPTVTPIATEN